MVLKKNEKQIISELRRNSRAKITEISQRTKIPESTVHDTIKRIQKKGIQPVMLPYYEKLHLALRTIIVCKEKQNKESLNENNVWIVRNSASQIIECIFSNMLEQENFLNTIQGSFKTYNVLEYNQGKLGEY